MRYIPLESGDSVSRVAFTLEFGIVVLYRSMISCASSNMGRKHRKNVAVVIFLIESGGAQITGV